MTQPMTPGRFTSGEVPSFVLVGSAGLWAADCLVPGCLWTTTGPTPETTDSAALCHAQEVHAR
jgi:hypothetical protein